MRNWLAEIFVFWTGLVRIWGEGGSGHIAIEEKSKLGNWLTCSLEEKSKIISVWITGMIEKGSPWENREGKQIYRKTEFDFRCSELELLAGCEEWGCGIFHVLSLFQYLLLLLP